MKKPYGYWQQSAQDLAILHDTTNTQKDGYIYINRNGNSHVLHVWIWEQLVGSIPVGYEIDHINGIRHDCRLVNLRCVPRVINMRNSQKQINNTSGITGVSRITDHTRVYWVTTWSDPITGKQRRKMFSIGKYGEGGAMAMAIDYRAKILQELINNHGYTCRHGR